MQIQQPAPATRGPWRGRTDARALLTPRAVLTYGELAERVDQVVAALGAGRRLVLVEMTASPAAVVAYLAARQGGHVALLTQAGSTHAERILDRYDPDVVMAAVDADAELPSIVERRPGSSHDLHPELSLLLSTSGSTGSPRLVRLSQENVESNAAAIAGYLRLTADDVAITSLPLHYCYGLSVLNSHLAAGAAVVLSDASVVDDRFWRAFAEHGVTNLAGVPHTFELLDHSGFESKQLPSLRFVTQAGGRLPPDAVRRFADLGAARGWELYVMYGQTEATARMAYLPPELAATHPGCVGVPIPGGSLRIEPLADALAPDGAGELVYAGPNVMLGYAETAGDLALGRTTTELRTGDLARQTPAGLFEVVGRRSRFVKPYGLRIDLDELERALEAVGIDAPCAGDDTGVVVAVGRATQRAEAERTVRALSALPASALEVVTVPQLPRTSSGKTDYQAILGLREGPAAGTSRADVRDLYGELLSLPPHEIGGTDTFASLGGDSLTYVELAIHLERAIGPLPSDWHQRPIDELTAVAAPARSTGTRLDTTVLLRAAAILAIVVSHASTITASGGAHLLLVVSGFNFARFQLAGTRRAAGLGSLWRSIGRVAVPSVLGVAALQVATGELRPAQLLLVNSLLGAPAGQGHWRFWYVEVLVHLLLLLVVVLRSPAVRSLEQRDPVRFAWGLLAVTVVLRLAGDAVLHGAHPRFQLHQVAWLFALGWLLERSPTTRQRVAATSAAALGLVGYFGRPSVGVAVFAGFLLLAWFRDVPLPGWLARSASAVAAASLHVYLAHWTVLHLLDGRPAALAVAVSVAVGIALHRVTRRPSVSLLRGRLHG